MGYEMERYIGSLLGLAVGDALGTTLEFQTPGAFAPIVDIQGGGAFQLRPGQWTDDTSMALCLADSLTACGGFNPKDQMDRYVRWYRQGYRSSTGLCFGIGHTTRSALEQYEMTGNPFSGSTDPRRAGNGSLMRLASIPLYYAQDPVRAMAYCADSSRTTHGARTCVDACRLLGALIIGAVRGEAKSKLLAPFYHPVAGYWQQEPLEREIADIAAGSYRNKMPPAIRGTGYVAESLEAALWAFFHSGSFEEGVLLAVNLGNDADTTGAVYGQLAGAYYGETAIPEKWRHRVSQNLDIRKLATSLWKQACGIR